MAKKVKIGIKVPTSSELNRRYGNLLINPSTQERPKLWLPSRFLALNYQYGGGIPFGKILEVMGQESSGKAVPLDSQVLTSTGYKLMGELTLSDKVMDPVSGDPILIIGIYPQGLKRVYKVTFRDGTSAECSEDHLWEVQFRSHHQYKSQVLTIKEILEKGYRTKRASGKGKFKYKYNIPSTIPLNFEKKELPIHPYILGYILGDGGLGRANYIMFNIGLEDADSFKHNISKFLKEGAELEDKGIYENPFGKTHRFILKGYSKEIRSLCLEGKLSSDKFIPEDYLWSSVEDRKYLLAGLLDSDGTIGEQHNRAKYSSRFKFSSTSSKMIKQLVQVVRSLGGFITEPKPKTRERQFEGYEKRISKEIRTGGRLPFNPFMLERKRKQYQVKIENQTKSANYRRSIIDISYIGKKECQCIKVSSERGLFMLNDFIVTHNTLVAYDFAYCTQQLGGHVIWVDAEQSWDNSWAEQNGIELDKVTIISSTEIETISDAIADLSILWRSKLTHNEPILLVVDSIAAMDCTENINIKMTDGKAEMGGRAKALYKMFRIRTELLSKLGITQIYINQLRVALNVGFGQDNTCLHYNTMIPFVDGTSMKIGDIIKNKVSKEVWSYNEGSKRFEPKPIVDWVIKEETKKWIQFKTEGPETINGFNGFTCTYTHHCLTNHGWKKAKDITFEDKLITKQRRVINGTLKEFLWGTIPFDCSLYGKNGRSTSHITFSNGKQEDYLLWKTQMIEKAFPMKPKGSSKTKFISTRGYTELYDIYQKIGKERDPLKLWDLSLPLAPLTLAVWYMDDGHKYSDTKVGISISPNRTDLKELARYLTHVCKLPCNIYSHGIKFTKSGSQNLMEAISAYVIPSMQYKLLSGYGGRFKPFELDYSEEYLPKEVNILYINREFDPNNRRFRSPKQRKKYDITIPDNHNFLAGSVEQGVVVHNTSTGGKALGFYASIRSAFYAGKQVTKKVKGKERKVGKLVSIRPIKNKVSPLRNTISKAPIYFNPKYVEYVGFDRYHGFADILVEEDVLEKTSGGIYKYKGKTVARGEEKFQSVVEEDDKLRRKLIKACGINTIRVTQSKIDELVEKGINLFPVDGNLDYESQSDDSEDEEEEEEFED